MGSVDKEEKYTIQFAFSQTYQRKSDQNQKRALLVYRTWQRVQSSRRHINHITVKLFFKHSSVSPVSSSSVDQSENKMTLTDGSGQCLSVVLVIFAI